MTSTALTITALSSTRDSWIFLCIVCIMVKRLSSYGMVYFIKQINPNSLSCQHISPLAYTVEASLIKLPVFGHSCINSCISILAMQRFAFLFCFLRYLTTTLPFTIFGQSIYFYPEYVDFFSHSQSLLVSPIMHKWIYHNITKSQFKLLPHEQKCPYLVCTNHVKWLCIQCE